jgi:Cu/Zn superoxide dismutase
MRLLKRFGWAAAALSAAVTMGPGVAPAGAAAQPFVFASGPLADLSPASNPTDGAYGQLYAIAPGDGNTYVVFVLTGLDPAAAGATYGAHVHVGPCVPGSGAAALGHYNAGTGGPPSPENEVWLDFTVLPGGFAVSTARVPFEIAPGSARSVVVHANATQPSTGNAGGRIACLPVAF